MPQKDKDPNNKDTKKYYTLKDLEEVLQLSHNTVSKLVHLEGFPAIRIGKSVRVRPDDLEKFMENYVAKSINL